MQTERTVTLEGAGSLAGKADVASIVKENDLYVWAVRRSCPSGMKIRFSKHDGMPNDLNGASGYYRIPLGELDSKGLRLPGSMTAAEFRALKPNDIVPNSGGMTKAQIEALPISSDVRQTLQKYARISEQAEAEKKAQATRQPVSSPENRQPVSTQKAKVKVMAKVKVTAAKAAPVKVAEKAPAKAQAPATAAKAGKTQTAAPKAATVTQTAPKAGKAQTFSVSSRLLNELAANVITSAPGRRPAGYQDAKAILQAAQETKGANRELALNAEAGSFLYRAITEKGAAGSMGKSGKAFAEELASAFKLNGNAPKAAAPAPAAKATATVTPAPAKRGPGRPPKNAVAAAPAPAKAPAGRKAAQPAPKPKPATAAKAGAGKAADTARGGKAKAALQATAAGRKK